ncbi:MAG: cytochrome C assembly protein, partial [Rhodothermales bacterium]|nr:cytochrome C assembly protein [Rhodothermales bacterium]
SAVPLEFYNKWTLPLSVLFVFLAGLGQLFWWNRMSVESINRVLLRPVALAVVSTAIVLVLTPFRSLTREASAVADVPMPSETTLAALGGLGEVWATHGFAILMLLLTFVAFFALYGNGIVLLRIARGNPKLAGGAFTHVGFAICLLGIIASSGFSKPIVQGSGVQIGENRDNFILTRGETRNVNGYIVTYDGQGVNEDDRPTYQLSITDPKGRSFEVAPVVYMSNKGQWIQHPEVTQFLARDLFVAVAPDDMFDTNGDQDAGSITLSRGDSVLIGGDRFSIEFTGFKLDVSDEVEMDSVEIAVAANIRLTDLQAGDTRELSPVYIINRDRSVNYIQNTVTDWDITVAFTGMNVDDGSINVALQGIEVEPEDWVVVQAYEKPLISLVWIGFIMLTFGFCISIWRRASDQRFASRRLRQTAP